MTRSPIVARTLSSLHRARAELCKRNATLALVPTMGALHDGHVSLVRLAKKRAKRVAVSIFVNPTQFAAHEDLGSYPRTWKEDIARLSAEGVDLVWHPDAKTMYPDGFATRIAPEGPALAGLEDKFRPHFFGGVATVVTKLLLQCLPDAALFGEKDYQQLQVIKRMTRDLDIPVEIVGCATVREADGLAMSSRNAYLSADERRIAARLNAIMHDAIKAVHAGVAIDEAEAEAARHVLAAGFASVDYIAIRDAETLERIGDLARPARILAAAWLGKTRLIDNMAV